MNVDVARTQRVTAALSQLSAGDKARMLSLLDEVTRPLSPRELEASLRIAGVSKSMATKMGSALGGRRIVLVAIEAEG